MRRQPLPYRGQVLLAHLTDGDELPFRFGDVAVTALALADGAITEAEQAVIVREMREKFGASGAAAEELLAHARWAVRDVAEVDTCVRRLLPVIEKTCGAQEREQLIEMLEAVAAANGRPEASERLSVERVKRALRHQMA